MGTRHASAMGSLKGLKPSPGFAGSEFGPEASFRSCKPPGEAVVCVFWASCPVDAAVVNLSFLVGRGPLCFVFGNFCLWGRVALSPKPTRKRMPILFSPGNPLGI